MKRQFKKVKMNSSSLALVSQMNDVLTDFSRRGYTLTLRQLYYQLVGQDLIPNSDRSYDKIGRLATNARLGGMMDWNAIEDRNRRTVLPYWVKNIPDGINDLLKQYRLDRQKDQPNYIEVWVEKDALSQIIGNVCDEWHIRFKANKGYSSTTDLYNSANRINMHCAGLTSLGEVRSPHIIYLSDHDASGLQMVEDIQKRLNLFGSFPKIHNVALTRKQVDQYQLPPNPAKMSDTRAKAYVQKHGHESWELDALDPDVMSAIVNDKIRELVDHKLFNKMIELEKAEKEQLGNIAEEIQEKLDNEEETED